MTGYNSDCNACSGHEKAIAANAQNLLLIQNEQGKKWEEQYRVNGKLFNKYDKLLDEFIKKHASLLEEFKEFKLESAKDDFKLKEQVNVVKEELGKYIVIWVTIATIIVNVLEVVVMNILK